MRSTSFGACGAVTMIPIATGAVSIPALSGEYSSTNWKYWVRRNVEPYRAKNVIVIVADAAEKRGFWKKCRSSIGCSKCVSHHANAPRNTSPTTNETSTVVSDRPRSGSSMIA